MKNKMLARAFLKELVDQLGKCDNTKEASVLQSTLLYLLGQPGHLLDANHPDIFRAIERTILKSAKVKITVTPAQAAQISDMLENPPRPTDTLRRAMKKKDE